ncbi:MAG: beta-ketoacyl-ACP synthase II [Candidatus Omnitrophica bacterium]|nr:beta-ketoacyl-ACP synthase II [Candidatus Omnitrophota bacterium]MDD5574397.1 beta-ketoacyl-ACP synthase II [Candidatus Omnitrophota bacterium]
MKRRVVVTGLGAVTPLGNTVAEFWKGLESGVSGVGRITHFDASAYDAQIAGQVKGFDPEAFMGKKEVKHTERFVHYAMGAATEAVADAGFKVDALDLDRCGVLIGSGIGSLRIIEEQHKVLLERGPSKLTPFLIPMLIVNEASGHVSMKFGFKGPNSCVATACATGNHAIGDAGRIIQYGDADVMIAGGTEGAVTPMGIGGFCALKSLSCRNHEPHRASRPFDKERDGFVMGEGAGLVILEEMEHALKRGARIYGELAGYGMSGDAYHITAPDPSGDGCVRAMRASLKDAGMKPEDIDYINAHGTSTLLNDKIETLAMKKTFGDHVHKVAISSTKSMTGHLLGAAGGAEFIVCCLAMKNGVVPPTINLENKDPDCDLDYTPNKAKGVKIAAAMSNALGFGGHNATIVLKEFKG